MAIAARAAVPHVISLVLFLSLTAARPVCADELTGAPHDDPKDLLPAPAQAPACAGLYEVGFLPLPSWARSAVMPSLPDTLKPMGRKIAVLTTPPVAAPQPLAPPKESAAPTVIVAKPAPVAPAPAPNPALIAVSPFLEWIKANPQTAAEQARQQASVYQAGSDATASTSPNGAPPGTNASGPILATPGTPAAAQPYWLPPLIDNAPFGTGNTTGSSAAIYSTPQR